MRTVVDHVEHLKQKYGGTISFKRICAEENIIAVKAALDEGVNAFSMTASGYKLIVCNEQLTWGERRDYALHELWHIQKSARSDQREERKADLFAALCRIPVVREGDTIDSLMEKYNCSRWIAHIRIEYEQRRNSN